MLIFYIYQGNLFVLVLFIRCKALRTRTNFLIANLIVADFLLAVFCIIPRMLENVHDYAINGVSCIIIDFYKTLKTSDFVAYVQIHSLHSTCHATGINFNFSGNLYRTLYSHHKTNGEQDFL